MSVLAPLQTQAYRSFYFLRHGPTAWNASGRLQGHTDTTLSTEGRAELQVRRVPDRFRRLPWITSPLLRARETASALGVPEYAVADALIEMHWGDWEGRTIPHLREELGERMRANEDAGLDFRPPRGESPREVGERVVAWLSQRNAERADSACVVVSHKGVIRAVLAHAWHWDMLGKPPVKLTWNCFHEVRLGAEGTVTSGDLNIPMSA